MKPIYAENLIVGIIHDGKFGWYILEKDLCFMDSEKVVQAYQNIGYDVPQDDDFRFGIKILDHHSVKNFLDGVKQYQISTAELQHLLKNEKEFNDRLAYNASLLIDFDRKMLFSYYPEPASFEAFVPDTWKGYYKDFGEYIPVDQRYWIGENGENLIKGETK